MLEAGAGGGLQAASTKRGFKCGSRPPHKPAQCPPIPTFHPLLAHRPHNRPARLCVASPQPEPAPALQTRSIKKSISYHRGGQFHATRYLPTSVLFFHFQSKVLHLAISRVTSTLACTILAFDGVRLSASPLAVKIGCRWSLDNHKTQSPKWPRQGWTLFSPVDLLPSLR